MWSIIIDHWLGVVKRRGAWYDRDMNRLKWTALHYGHVIVICCCLIMGVNAGVAMSCAGVFYTPVSEELGVKVGEVGLYMSFNFLASSLMLTVAGRMIVRYGARVLLSLSSALMGICLVSMGFFNAVWQFYLAGAGIGVSLAFLFYLSFPILINSWFRSRVGFYMGICSASMGIGGAALSPLCVSLIEQYGWRTAYEILGGGILLIITPLLALLLRNAPADAAPQAAKRPENTAPARLAPGLTRKPVFRALALYAFLVNATAPICLVMPSYVTQLESARLGGYVASAVMAGVAVGKIALGAINDKSHALGVIISAGFGIAGLLALSTGAVWLFLPGAFLFGWAFAGVSVQTPLLVRAVFGKAHYALINSKISIALALGGILAGGWAMLAGHTSYSFIFLLAGLFLLICLVLGLVCLSYGRHESE